MNYYFLTLGIICIICGYILIRYGNSNKKNPTALSEFAWWTGLASLVGGFSLLIFSLVSLKENPAIVVNYILLGFSYLIGFCGICNWVFTNYSKLKEQKDEQNKRQ